MNEVNSTLRIGTEVILNVHGIKNAVSLRPTSRFTNMVLTDTSTGKEMSKFEGIVNVTNTIVGNLPHRSANITQTSYDTLANNTVELEF